MARLFRPQQCYGPTRLKYNLRGDHWGQYNWRELGRYPRPKEPFNQQFLGNIFGYLHHLSDHAPEPVNRRWKHATRRFLKRHTGHMWRGTSRFLNKHTAHRWL